MTLRERLQADLGDTYRLEREIGGGMSRVFVAEETALGRLVVLKLLDPELAGGFSAERFTREIALAARLQDPHIVPVLATGVADGLPFYTMPFVEGASLRERITSGPRLDRHDAVRILRDVAIALEHAHASGVVHRDIKPENILLSPRSAVVTDFGIAKAIDAARTVPARRPVATTDESVAITQLGVSLGTPAYMAPEQVLGEAVDERADIYAWGVMAYELLSGAHPFGSTRDVRQLVSAHLTVTPSRLTAHPELGAPLVDLIAACLEKDSARRPRSATHLIAALDEATRAAERTGAHAGRRPIRVALARYGLAALAAIAASRGVVAWLSVPEWVFPNAVLLAVVLLPLFLYVNATHGWRRATTLGAAVGASFLALVAVHAVLRVLGIGPAGTLLGAGKLANRAPLIVAEFRVEGADSSLGSVVAEAVRADLAQSPVVSLVGAGAISDALTRMRKLPTTVVDARVAQDIAQREGITGVVSGDVKPLGGGFLVSIRLTAGASGDELASFRATADAPKDLIQAIERVSRQLRGKIGESLSAVRANPPLASVTTASVEALRLYAAGVRANAVEGDFDKAIALQREAIRIDTSFAMAYLRLAGALDNGRRSPEAADSARISAYRHRERLTEGERLMTTAEYFLTRRDYPNAVRALERAVERDSLDATALNALATQQRFMRAFAAAEVTSRRAIRAAPQTFFNYTAVIVAQLGRGDIVAATKSYAALKQTQPNLPRLERMRYLLHASTAQLDSIGAPLARMAQSKDPFLQTEAALAMAALAAVHGRATEASRAFANISALRQERGGAPAHAGVADSARVDVWIRHDGARAARVIEDALARLAGRRLSKREEIAYLELVELLAVAGRPDRASALLGQWASRADTASKRMNAALVLEARAETALAQGHWDDAIALFRSADALPSGPRSMCTICLSAQLARAFDRAGRTDSAIVRYEYYLATPYHLRLAEDAWHLPHAHERLGFLYAASGDAGKARAHLKMFAALWAEADAELRPRITAAQTQLARLRVATTDARASR